MSKQNECPSHDILVDLINGNLSSSEFDRIQQHVSACSACLQKLDTLDEKEEQSFSDLTQVSDADLERAQFQMELEKELCTTIVGQVFSTNLLKLKNATTLTPPCELGPYKIKRLIARGGTGEVYEAYHTRLNRPVAVKLIRRYMRGHADTRQNFLAEMATIGQLDHPNLVRAYDAWELDENLYLVQELLEGETLQSLGALGEFTSISDILPLFTQVCQALEYLHSHGLIHRDVKPGNIIRLTDGSIKLIDFGLVASVSADQDQAGRVVGTRAYMSPEQADGTQPLDVRTDIYSAGCVLRFLLNCVRQGPEFTSRDEPGFQHLDIIATRMTRENREDRYADFTEILTALQNTSFFNQSKSLLVSVSIFLFLFTIWLYSNWSHINSSDRNGETGPFSQFVEGWFSQSEDSPALPEADHFTNYAGIPFQKILPPPRDTRWPPSAKNADMKAGGARDLYHENSFLAAREITRSEYFSVMGEGSDNGGTESAIDVDLPMTDVSYDDVEHFCELLTQNDPNGFSYRIPEITELTNAAYDEELREENFPEPAAASASQAVTKTLKRARECQSSKSGVRGIFSNAWEWTNTEYHKTINLHGKVDYSRFGEYAAERTQIIHSGDVSDIFIHAADINLGMNDFYDSSNGLRIHIEPDRVTKYFCPAEVGKKAYIRYRYAFKSPIQSARINPIFHLFNHDAHCEIRICGLISKEAAPLEKDWEVVYSSTGKTSPASPVDVSDALKGYSGFLVEYSVFTETEPAHFCQIARTTPSSKLSYPNVLRVEVNLERGENRSIRRSRFMPRSLKHPLLGFRVIAYIPSHKNE